MNNRICVAPYIGAKTGRIREALIELLPRQNNIHTYVEPFGGMFNIGLLLSNYSIRIYNELNPKLYDLFRFLSDRGACTELLIQMVTQTQFSPQCFLNSKSICNDKAKYPLLSPIDKAMHVWVLLLQSMNGNMEDFKEIRKGTEDLIYKESLVKKHELPILLSNVQVSNMDGLELIKLNMNNPHVVMYLDPPYTLRERTSKKLYKCDMTDLKQYQLINLIEHSKSKILLSGYQNKLYDSILTESKNWYSLPLIEASKAMAISANGSLKSRVTEWVWMNYNPKGVA